MTASPASAAGHVRCPACLTLQDGPWVLEEETTRACKRCQQPLRITVFPALLVPGPAVAAGTGAPALEGEATCFFHPEKRAERPCDRCGRFLCTLCDLPVGARHLCPACLREGQEEKALPELVASRVSWGRLSFLLAITPLIPLVSVFFVFTAPAAIFVALFGWNRPGSLVHGRRRFAAIVGLLLGMLQIAGLVFIFYNLWKNATHRAA